MATEQIGVGMVFQSIETVLTHVRTATITKEQETKRLQAIMMLEGIQHIIEAFCLAQGGSEVFFQSPFTSDDK